MFRTNNISNINTTPPSLTDTSHVDKIPLSHLPPTYQPKNKHLLREFSDVFSKNGLDLGHCKTLPQPVKLKDPKKIVSINQYRLPHHLKEAAVDYVQKLLAAGVVRKSNYYSNLLSLRSQPRVFPTTFTGSSSSHCIFHFWCRTIFLCSIPPKYEQ